MGRGDTWRRPVPGARLNKHRNSCSGTDRPMCTRDTDAMQHRCGTGTMAWPRLVCNGCPRIHRVQCLGFQPRCESTRGMHRSTRTTSRAEDRNTSWCVFFVALGFLFERLAVGGADAANKPGETRGALDKGDCETLGLPGSGPGECAECL